MRANGATSKHFTRVCYFLAVTENVHFFVIIYLLICYSLSKLVDDVSTTKIPSLFLCSFLISIVAHARKRTSIASYDIHLCMLWYGMNMNMNMICALFPVKLSRINWSRVELKRVEQTQHESEIYRTINCFFIIQLIAYSSFRSHTQVDFWICFARFQFKLILKSSNVIGYF